MKFRNYISQKKWGNHEKSTARRATGNGENITGSTGPDKSVFGKKEYCYGTGIAGAVSGSDCVDWKYHRSF